MTPPLMPFIREGDKVEVLTTDFVASGVTVNGKDRDDLCEMPIPVGARGEVFLVRPAADNIELDGWEALVAVTWKVEKDRYSTIMYVADFDAQGLGRVVPARDYRRALKK